MFRKNSRVPRSVTDPTRVETDQERRLRLAGQIARKLDERFVEEAAATEQLRIRGLGNLAKRAVEPTDSERIPVYPGVRPASVQMREDSIAHNNPHMEGVRWVDFKGAKETRVHRSFEVHPLKLVDVGYSAKNDPASRVKKFWKGEKKRWEISTKAERRWVLEDSDRKIMSDERPIEFKPRKIVDAKGLDAAIDGEIGYKQATWPQWFARGERPAADVRPTEELPSARAYPMTLPTKGSMFEAVERYAAGNNEYNREFDCDLIGLSWTGMEQTTWDDLDYKTRQADGSLPPKLDCEITDSWDYVGESGFSGKSWLEERRHQGVLVDVVIHDIKSMESRLQKAFVPKGSTNGMTCVPAENIAWQVRDSDTAGPAIPAGP